MIAGEGLEAGDVGGESKLAIAEAEGASGSGLLMVTLCRVTNVCRSISRDDPRSPGGIFLFSAPYAAPEAITSNSNSRLQVALIIFQLSRRQVQLPLGCRHKTFFPEGIASEFMKKISPAALSGVEGLAAGIRIPHTRPTPGRRRVAEPA
jgi:hypothetical protein